MKSKWSDAEFKSVVDAYVGKGVNRDLAIRTYTTRLLGSDPTLVLHGGGNTSVKTVFTDFDGSDVPVLCVKGSGWDMGTIEPPGLPAVRLEPLKAMVKLDALSDDEMVMLQRRLLMDPAAPNPSVEAILHALLPFKHIDHTHANAIVSLTNKPHGEDVVREIFPDAIVLPWVMPGFDLAKACDAAFAANPGADGMVLIKHGIFSWSEDPRESYEKMIEGIDKAEKRIARGKAHPFKAVALPKKIASAADIAPVLRGAIAVPTKVEGNPKRFILEHRTGPEILEFCNAENLESLVSRGNATPEHVIHIKRFGVALPAPVEGELDAWAETARKAVADYQEAYRQYFERNNARMGGNKVMLDPSPRAFYVAGVGIFAAGATAKAAAISGDVMEATITVIRNAEGIESFEALTEEQLFDVEYWSLEQVKINKTAEKPLTRQVAVVTGGAGGLGFAIAEALKAEGAEIALLDLSEDAVSAAAKKLGGLGVACDVTKADAVDAAFAKVAERFGGVDILISNAGAAFQGALVSVSDDVFRQAFELNFWGHHHAGRAAVRIMKKQRSGGALVFNVSKQAVNPGPDFGPYGTSKAALMALMRQYAVEHGADGITANAVNADRIRTGLLTEEMVQSRSKARGVSPEVYMRGNLVGREVTGADVAAAFVHLAKARTSTGAVITVDGGNVAAMMR